MMRNSYRLTMSIAPDLGVVDAGDSAQQDRVDFRICFMIWMGLIASTWAGIAFIISLF